LATWVDPPGATFAAVRVATLMAGCTHQPRSVPALAQAQADRESRCFPEFLGPEVRPKIGTGPKRRLPGCFCVAFCPDGLGVEGGLASSPLSVRRVAAFVGMGGVLVDEKGPSADGDARRSTPSPRGAVLS